MIPRQGLPRSIYMFYGISRRIWVVPRTPPTFLGPQRTLYIAARKQINRADSSNQNHQKQHGTNYKELQRKQQLLEEKIKNITAYQQTLRGYISFKEDEQARELAAKREGLTQLDLETLPSDQEINEFDQLLHQISGPQISAGLYGGGLFANALQTIELPPALLDRIGSAITNISSNDKAEQNWPAVVDTIKQNGGFTKKEVKEVDMLLYNIPLAQRPHVLPNVMSMMTESEITPNVLTYGLISSAYAESGNTKAIYDMLVEMKSRGLTPNVHIYGNLLKALSRENNIDESAKIVDIMRQQNVTFSTETYTILMQACLKQRNHVQVAEIFDMMKFVSEETRPDLKAYCTMMLSAAQQYQIERVLDLYRELNTPQNVHLLNNADKLGIQNLYNILIYSCSRDPRTHLKAWEFLLKLKDEGLAIDRRSVESLMYLCGKTGEIMLSRAMFKQLCQNAISYPSAMTLTSLFNAYKNFTPTQTFSKVLNSPLASQIQANFVFDDVSTSEKSRPDSPPFLPIPFLTDRVQVVAESRAIMTFFSEHLPVMVNEKTVLAYLSIPASLGNMSELKYRWNSHTYLPSPQIDSELQEPQQDSRQEILDDSGTDVSSDLSSTVKVPRNHYLYDLAMQACVDARDAEFGSELWQERGLWRKTSEFKQMRKSQRDQSDFLFARKTVNLLAVCGEFEDAINVLNSTIDQFNWKPHHIEPFINKLTELDDQMTLEIVRRLLRKRFRAARQYQEFYDHESLKSVDALRSVNKAY